MHVSASIHVHKGWSLVLHCVLCTVLTPLTGIKIWPCRPSLGPWSLVHSIFIKSWAWMLGWGKKLPLISWLKQRWPPTFYNVPYSGKLWWVFLIWRFGKFDKDRQIKNRQFKLNACVPMMLSIQIAKFKFCQYQLRAVSPSSMLAKVIRYAVVRGIGSKQLVISVSTAGVVVTTPWYVIVHVIVHVHQVPTLSLIMCATVFYRLGKNSMLTCPGERS